MSPHDDVDVPDAPVIHSVPQDRASDVPASDGSDAMAGWEDDWQRGDVLGDYELTEKLGEGGMSRVYEGRHRTLGTRVAIKTLRPEHRCRELIRTRFEREASATARVHHPNVVKVITVGTHRGAPYLVMEFLSGRDLERRIEEGGPMPVREALSLLIPVFAAVQEAHDQGLIHRDLKPANIMLEQWRDGRVRPVVVDFGIARMIETPTAHRLTHGLLGTPAYMAPEQTRGERRLDASLDQYALGAIVYECLAGVPAFQGESVYELLARVSAGSFTPLEQMRRDIPDALAKAVARAMSADVAQRYPSVRSFARALLPFADDVVRAQWRDVFAGDDATEGAATMPDQTPPEEPTPKPVRAAPQPRHGTTLGGAAHAFATSTTPPPSRRMSLRLVAAVTSCLVLVAGLVVALTRGSVSEPPVRFVAAVAVEPPTARVIVDGTLAGVGGFRGVYVADGSAHRVHVEADGCAAEELTFVNASPPDRLRLRCAVVPPPLPLPAVVAAPTPVQQVLTAPQPAPTARRGQPSRARRDREGLSRPAAHTGADCIGPNGTDLCL